MKNPKKDPNGFTLIELLLVIAVITILMALLASGLLTATAKAKRAQCASNMRQILVALSLYEQSYRVFPLFSANNVLITSLYSPTDASKRLLDDPNVLHCPSHRSAQDTVEHSYYSYSGKTYYSCYFVNTLLSAGLTSDGYLGVGGGEYEIISTVLIIDSLYDTDPRHGEGSNLGFADGHVEWYNKSAYTGADPNNSANVGWKNWGRKN